MIVHVHREQKTVSIKDAGQNELTLTVGNVYDLYDKVCEEFCYREDVVNRIDALLEFEDLPEMAADNDHFIDAVTEKYAELRRENDGGEYPVFWGDLLDEALKQVDYEKY